MRGRSQGGRAVFIVLIDIVALEMRIRMLVLLSLSILVKIRIWTVDLGLDIRILGVALVELIDKRLIFGIDNNTNR